MVPLIFISALAVLTTQAFAGNCGNSSWIHPTTPSGATFAQLPVFYVGDQLDIEFLSDFATIFLRIYQQPMGAGTDILRSTNPAEHVITQWKVGNDNMWNYNEGNNGPIYYLEFYGPDSSQDCTSGYFRLSFKAGWSNLTRPSGQTTNSNSLISSSAITSPTGTSTPTPPPEPADGLSTGAKIGIGVGLGVGVFLVLLILLTLYGPLGSELGPSRGAAAANRTTY